MLTKKEIRKNETASLQMALNIIGTGTHIKGNLISTGDLRIDGSIEGLVDSKAKVVVGPGSEIIGNIQAQNADISGTVHGNVTVAETLFLKATARIQGDIITNKLVVESGAAFNGSCVMKTAAEDSGYGQQPREAQQEKSA